MKHSLNNYPVVAILGPRQCGKSTLADKIISKINNTIKLDLEKQSDFIQLEEIELFLDIYKEKFICLDEIQRKPDLFKSLRSFIDEQKRNGLLLILRLASLELIKQSSETLAGRILSPGLTRDFWKALGDVKPDKSFCIAPVKNHFFLSDSIRVCSPEYFIKNKKELIDL